MTVFKFAFRLTLIAMLLMSGIAVLAQDATPAPEELEQMQQEEQPVGDGESAYVRVANFASGAEGVNLSLNADAESSSFDEVSARQVGEWMAVTPGTYSLNLGSGGADAAQPTEVTVEAGTWTTLAVVGSPETDGLMVAPVQEAYLELIPGTAGFTVIHAAENVPTLNLLRDGVVYVSELTHPGTVDTPAFASFRIDSGTYDVSFVTPDQPDTPVIDLPQTEIPENGYTLFAVVNGESGPESIVHTTTGAEVAMVTGMLEEPGTVLEAAEANENLAGLVDALEQAGLTEELSGEGPYTIFAPASFALDDVTANGGDLSALLRAHIVEGEMTSQDVFSAGTLTTLDGTQLQVNVDGNNVFINDAQIIETNIPATNGVIHIINGVLAP